LLSITAILYFRDKMLMKPHRYILGIILTLVLNTCEKIDLEVDVPDCIKQEIRAFKKTPEGCAGAQVMRYDYDGTKVYAFEPGLCGADMPTYIYDGDCHRLCIISGFTGGSLCNGQNFYEHATHGALVWKN
jgi:hypothetical protein